MSLPGFLPFFFFFFNDTATTEIYTLSLHDALPIFPGPPQGWYLGPSAGRPLVGPGRSEEHTSELQSQFHLVCRLLLEKKNRLDALQPHHALTLKHHPKRDVYYWPLAIGLVSTLVQQATSLLIARRSRAFF